MCVCVPALIASLGDVTITSLSESLLSLVSKETNMESATTVLRILPLIAATVCVIGATDEISGMGPYMLSTPSNLRVMEGDTVVLPCKVMNLGRNIRVWKQLPGKLLFSGSIAVSRDSRVSLDNESLQIERITTAYAGEYVCQISKHPQVNVLHRIQVQVPPSMSPDPPEGKVIFRKGESANIFCNPSGIPKPHIMWTYGDEENQGTALPRGVRQVQGSQLHFSSVDVHHAGVYKCIADNDVGEPAVATFNLNVHYAPELLVKPEWAHGDVGATVEFVCICKSSPVSQIAWLQGDHKQGQKMENGGRIRLKLKQTGTNTYEYSLRIQRLKREDLVPYTCTAKNPVGSMWRTVEISGLAEPVHLRGNESGEGSFLLRWRAKSYSPIIEYQLKIRKFKSGDQWTDVVIPASMEEGQSLLYSQSYNVTGLEPGVRYEAVLHVHNDFGWNRPSETFLFGEESMPTEQELEDTEAAPSLLPFYDAELDVTDPTYLKQNSAAVTTPIYTIPHLIYLTFIFVIHLHIFCS